jgi:hypothetical protein
MILSPTFPPGLPHAESRSGDTVLEVHCFRGDEPGIVNFPQRAAHPQRRVSGFSRRGCIPLQVNGHAVVPYGRPG